MPKRFCVAIVILLVVMMAVSFLPVHGEQEVYDTVVRLHVLANSDSEEDQALKLTVRDAVLEAAAPYLEGYRRRCLTLRRDVRLVQNGLSTPAYALDVDEALGLLVRYPDGTEATVRSGEASVRGLTGYVE